MVKGIWEDGRILDMSSIVIFGRNVGCPPKKESILHLRITTKLEKKATKIQVT